MIDLHFVPTPNGHKVSILLEELGLAYRLLPYDMLAGDQLAPAFRAVNPNGRAAGDRRPGSRRRRTALCGLRVRRHPALPVRDVRWRVRAQGAASTLVSSAVADVADGRLRAHARSGPSFHPLAPEGQDYAVARYANEARRLLGVLDRRLGEAEYLAEEYSVADIAVWPWVRATRAIAMPLDPYPRIVRWFEAIGERPAVRRGRR